MNVKDHQITTCYHCGEECREEILHFDNKNFCCTGCQLVFEVLQENEMGSYYDIAPNPGPTQKSATGESNRFDYLDDEDVVRKLLDFSDDKESHITFTIPVIHCASCIWLLENLQDRKSTRLNSSHVRISYAVFCLKKKKKR